MYLLDSTLVMIEQVLLAVRAGCGVDRLHWTVTFVSLRVCSVCGMHAVVIVSSAKMPMKHLKAQH